MTINQSITTGLSFGLSSGIITTLGVMMGLNAGTHSKVAVVGGILTIAIADSISDSFGIHMSEETDEARNSREVWQSTIATLVTKFLVVSSFLIPVFLYPLEKAIFLNLIWGMYMLLFFSLYIAHRTGRSFSIMALKHILLALVIVVLTNAVGNIIADVL